MLYIECLCSFYRENEIRIDMTITPIEETYALLNKYNIFFNDGNAERVDTLSYGWKKLIAQVSLAFSLLHDDKFLYFNCYSIYNVINQGFIFSK